MQSEKNKFVLELLNKRLYINNNFQKVFVFLYNNAYNSLQFYL